LFRAIKITFIVVEQRPKTHLWYLFPWSISTSENAFNTGIQFRSAAQSRWPSVFPRLDWIYFSPLQQLGP
jgi:hypothetical protein